jgi:CBS-domain-containing membrane protein
MTPEPATVSRRTSVKEALTLLARRRVTALPVVEPSGRLYGIVSEADLISETVPRDPRAQERPVMVESLYPPHEVADVCTRSVVSVRADDDVATAVELMTATGAKSLPVLDDEERLVGIVSRSDVVAALARSDDAIAADIDARLASLGRNDWLVEVEDGAVSISGPDGVAERSLAHVVAQTVAGVVEVRVSG